MKAILKLEGLCCANCAAKIEERVRKLPGVEEADLSFMTQKLILVCDDDRAEEIIAEADVIARKIEGDVEIKRVK